MVLVHCCHAVQFASGHYPEGRFLCAQWILDMAAAKYYQFSTCLCSATNYRCIVQCCKVQLFQVSWNIIFMLHILVHVAGRDPDMSLLLDVQWNFSVASLIVE
jgi:hypothetical protein